MLYSVNNILSVSWKQLNKGATCCLMKVLKIDDVWIRGYLLVKREKHLLQANLAGSLQQLAGNGTVDHCVSLGLKCH